MGLIFSWNRLFRGQWSYEIVWKNFVRVTLAYEICKLKTKKINKIFNHPDCERKYRIIRSLILWWSFANDSLKEGDTHTLGLREVVYAFLFIFPIGWSAALLHLPNIPNEPYPTPARNLAYGNTPKRKPSNIVQNVRRVATINDYLNNTWFVRRPPHSSLLLYGKNLYTHTHADTPVYRQACVVYTSTHKLIKHLWVQKQYHKTKHVRARIGSGIMHTYAEYGSMCVCVCVCSCCL